MFKNLIVYGEDIITGKYHGNKYMDITSFIYLDGKLDELNGYDLCSIPEIGKRAEQYNGKDEIIEECVVITHHGKCIDAQIHLIWNGRFYTGLVSDKNDDASKENAKKFVEEHRDWYKKGV